MTANLAFSYGREVYAIPGRIDDICSQGCNRLIRGKVAEAVTGDDEFLKSLGMTAGKKKNMVTDKEKIASIYGRDMAPDRLELMTKSLIMIRKCRGITIEELSGSIGVDYSTAAKLTGLLESDGLISIDLLQRCCINISK